MNIKIEQKKEYIKPQMTVIECEHEGVLCGSDCANCDDCNENEFDADLLD